MRSKLPIISFLQKLIIFLLPDFRRIQKEVSKSGIYGQLPEQSWSKGSFDFQKLCPSGHQGLLFKWFQNEKRVFIEMDLLPTIITNSFQIQNQTFEKHFHFLYWLYDHFIPFFLEVSAKIHNDKSVQNKVHLFHVNADIKAKFTFTNENKNCP